MNDLVSLTVLIDEKGCKVLKVDEYETEIKLPAPSTDTMRFLREDDGLYYMEVELIDDEAETVNATAIVSDDESGGNEEGGKDDGSADGGDNGGDDDTDPKAKNREPVDINRANQILNHPGETKLKQLAQKLNWTLTGTLLICEFCAKSKATAKPTKKETEKKAEAPGERLHMDKSGPYKLTRGKNRHWLLVVDQK